MKKLSVLLLLAMLTHMVSAQISFYVMGGISPESNPVHAALLINRHLPAQEFSFNMKQVKPQYFGGLKARFDLPVGFFAEIGAQYTQRKSVYTMVYTHPRETGRYHEMMETEHLIRFPANFGVKLQAFEITSGLSASTLLSAKGDLHRMKEVDSQEPTLRLGWQGGIGVSLHTTRFGLEYQSQLQRVCTGMSFNGKSLELRHIPGQCVFFIQQKI